MLSYVELFQGRLRDYITESLTRGTKYLPMIQNVFRAEGLPLDLAYIPIIESGFKTNALSKASAKGPWQFMKATAIENGLKHDWFVDERSDPEKATVAAAKYLKTLHKMFNGDWNLVLAAYNGGLGRLQRAMNRVRDRRFLGGVAHHQVPAERDARVRAAHPRRDHRRAGIRSSTGFDIASQDPIAYDKVAVPRAVDLRRVAEWTGTAVDDIQALNPELRRWTTPIRYPDFELKVPPGTGPVLEAQARGRVGLPISQPSSGTPCAKARPCWASPRKLKVSRVDLAEANSLSVPLAREGRTGLDHPAAACDPPRDEHGSARAGRSRVAFAERHCHGALAAAAQGAGHHLPGQTWRHALPNRAALRHHRRRTEGVEQAEQQHPQHRRPAHDSPLRNAALRGPAG